MGTWGTGVLDDDLARDVYDSYLEAAQQGRSADEIITNLRTTHETDLADPGHEAVFWLAVAHAQRDCGAVQRNVRERVEHAIGAGVGLEYWREAGTAELGRRKAVLTRFLASLSRAPSKRSRMHTKNQPESVDLEIGDCLSIELQDGRFAAAIVTRDHRDSTSPSHILTFIDATGDVPPPRGAFDPPRWLILAPRQFPNLAPKFEVYADGFARHRKRYRVIMRIAVGSVPEPLTLRQATWATLWRRAADVLELTD